MDQTEKKHTPAISIIMPCYNVERYIRKSLGSVFGQTFQDFEVVLINDGSTDRTQELINEYVEKYPDRIQSFEKKNEGQSKARNEGLDHACGEYIVFLDSDDYIDVDYLETLYMAAKEHDSEMVLSGQKKVDIHGNTIANISYPVDKNPEFVLRRLNPHGKMYQRAFLDRHQIRFAEGKLYEDNPFNFMAMFLARNMVILPYNGHSQVIHEGSTMTKRVKPERIPYEAIEHAIQYNQQHRELINDESIFEFTVMSFLTYFIFQANKRHIYSKEQIKGRKSDHAMMTQICRYTRRIMKQYFPKYWKNPHVGIFKHKDLVISQRLGVWLFVLLCKTGLLTPFTYVYYLF
ncbi:MAG: glycosyltransferase family 2 protein [Clostridia bacterium]|nr:glycosyltransferase family 2 protein [Clostridia bacterium]